jgi:hypothetical protein
MDTIHLLDIRNARFVYCWYFMGDQGNDQAKRMSLEQGIRDIIFDIGRDIKIHKFTEDNLIIEIDYEKYTKQILDLIENPGDK